MIQANELRIGNWVFIDNGQTPKYTYEITAHDIEEIEGCGDDTFPIPLTPELLEKCGFVKGKYDWDHETDGYSDNNILFSEATKRWHFTAWEGCRYGAGFEYLHQLQNFHFALTGQELTVNL